jgi:hypothetical protein
MAGAQDLFMILCEPLRTLRLNALKLSTQQASALGFLYEDWRKMNL